MNFCLGILCILAAFGAIVLIEKFFGKEGLFVWVSLSTVIANILVCKSISLAGFTTNLGNVLFASNFLLTDIISEKYGAKQSRKAILLGVCSQVMFVASTQLALFFVPSSTDLAQNSMRELFSLNLRVSIASITLYFLSNMLDIALFEAIKRKIPGKLWLRNNVATIFSNCLENYAFTFLAFAGVFDWKTMVSIATLASLLEMLIALSDTPFLYLSKKISPSGKTSTVEKP